ncbi:30110_t:CDS:1, partial [Gigaspora margarita]
CCLELYLSDEYKNIHKDILALQKDINNLENFHLKKEFGEYYGVLMI